MRADFVKPVKRRPSGFRKHRISRDQYCELRRCYARPLDGWMDGHLPLEVR